MPSDQRRVSAAAEASESSGCIRIQPNPSSKTRLGRIIANEIWQRSHGDMLLVREESGRESKGNNREQSRKRKAKQTGQGNGWKDRKSAEKCWTYADARRGILRQRKKRQHQGAKQEARTDGLKRELA